MTLKGQYIEKIKWCRKNSFQILFLDIFIKKICFYVYGEYAKPSQKPSHATVPLSQNVFSFTRRTMAMMTAHLAEAHLKSLKTSIEFIF
jgi:hypothetical protein